MSWMIKFYGYLFSKGYVFVHILLGLCVSQICSIFNFVPQTLNGFLSAIQMFRVLNYGAYLCVLKIKLSKLTYPGPYSGMFLSEVIACYREYAASTMALYTSKCVFMRIEASSIYNKSHSIVTSATLAV